MLTEPGPLGLGDRGKGQGHIGSRALQRITGAAARHMRVGLIRRVGYDVVIGAHLRLQGITLVEPAGTQFYPGYACRRLPQTLAIGALFGGITRVAAWPSERGHGRCSLWSFVTVFRCFATSMCYESKPHAAPRCLTDAPDNQDIGPSRASP